MRKAIQYLKTLNKQILAVFLANILIIIFEVLYLLLRFRYLNRLIPFWYTKSWGDPQLADKIYVFLIPLTAFLIICLGFVFFQYVKKNFMRYGAEMVLMLISFCNVALLLSLLRIMRIASTDFSPLINPMYLKLSGLLIVSFVVSYFFTPKFIEFAKRKNIVTDPNVHQHPGMLLVKPSARGGGVVFAVSFFIVALVSVVISKQMAGILAAVIFTALIGFADDIANTNQKSRLKMSGNPLVRLLILQPISVLIIVFSGIQTNFIGNPFDGVITLDKFSFFIGQHQFAPLAIAFTFLWIIWVVNMLSFSNGVDGQYSGIVGIAGIVIAILSLRLLDKDPTQIETAKLAVIASGAALGLIPFTWHPSKIMWGFGATTVGLVLATLSIISGAKIATSIIVLLIPFLDAAITVTRRIVQGKSPVKGDRGHLHHLLMERGWGVKKVAIFYWATTALFGTIALLSSERDVALVALTLSGIVAFILILLNLKSEAKKLSQQQAE